MRQIGCDGFIAGLTGSLIPEDTTFFKANGANEKVLPKPVSLGVLEGLWKEYGVVGSASTDAGAYTLSGSAVSI